MLLAGQINGRIEKIVLHNTEHEGVVDNSAAFGTSTQIHTEKERTLNIGATPPPGGCMSQKFCNCVCSLTGRRKFWAARVIKKRLVNNIINIFYLK